MSLPEQDWYQTAISRRKRRFADRLQAPMSELAEACQRLQGDPAALDQALATALPSLTGCELLYVLDRDGRQMSSNVYPQETQPQWRGQELAHRPYLQGNLPYRGIVLSDVYRSVRSQQPAITALHALRRGGELLGFLAADFPLAGLNLSEQTDQDAAAWTQYRGDPAIRGNLFQQTRVVSAMDQSLDEVLETTGQLLSSHGIFHSKLHFSSGRVTLWSMADPYSYRMHHLDELLDPALTLLYPTRDYPTKAQVDAEDIARVLAQFAALREADETVYLRSASVNLMNGMVGLTFSCDGSHYMPVAEFLERELGFWFGRAPSLA